MRREAQGLAAGSPWPCDFGPDLSRGFRALKTWFTFKVYGAEALGASIARTCELARYLENRIAETPELELAAPVELNIVCFRYRAEEAHRVNARIAVELQESGVAAPSTTIVGGQARDSRGDRESPHAAAPIWMRWWSGLWRWAALWRTGRRAALRPRTPATADWPPRAAREAALREMEARIAAEPEA